MKICITANEASLEANVDPRFGRCPFFLIVDPETREFVSVENQSAQLGGGAGIQAAQLVAKQGVEFVLTGNCGPNAHQALAAAGIGVITGCAGAVRDVIEKYQAGEFQATDGPNVTEHFGMNAPAAPGAAPKPASPARGGGGGGGGGRGQGGGGRGQGGGGRGQGGGGGR